MTKTKETLMLESGIHYATKKRGVFGCFEVTIGVRGKERVDYMTYDMKGIWRCYEIKVSVNDFRSKAKKTFCGNYNYYVLTRELYEQVKDEIPATIGVYINKADSNSLELVKKPKRTELTIDVEILRYSIMRSMYRETQKVIESETDQYKPKRIYRKRSKSKRKKISK